MLCITKTRVLERYAQLLQFSLNEVDQASVEQLLMLRVDFTEILLVQKANQPHTKFRNIVVFIDKQAYCLLFREGELQPQSELLIGATFRFRFLVLIVQTESLYVLLVPVRVILLIVPMTIHTMSIHVVVIIISVIASLVVVIVPLVPHMATVSSHRFVHWIIESVRVFFIEIACVMHLRL